LRISRLAISWALLVAAGCGNGSTTGSPVAVDERQTKLNSLGAVRDGRVKGAPAEQALLLALRSSDDPVRAEAMNVLVITGKATEAVKAEVGAIERTANLAVRLEATRALVAVAPGDPTTRDAVLRTLRDVADADEDRVLALTSSRELAPLDLRDWLTSPEPRWRRRAAKYVRESNTRLEPVSVQVLVALLRDEDSVTRLKAADCLGFKRAADPAARDALRECMRDPSWGPWVRASRPLAEMGAMDEDLGVFLREKASAPDPEERKSVCRTLAGLWQEPAEQVRAGIAILDGLAEDADPGVAKLARGVRGRLRELLEAAPK
jgi:HEAT repeat protein